MTTLIAETLEDQHTSEQQQQQQQQQEDQEGEGSELLLLEAPDDEKDEEFSFVCLLDLDTSSSSPISAADDLFHDGQIRAPLYPLIFNQAALIFDNNDDHHHQSTSPCPPQLRKIFIEQHPTSPCSSSKQTPTETALCEWSGKKSSSSLSPIASSSSPDRCKKSNSTGFSKLWRFRDLLHRSSSDGKDTFVFLHHHHPPSAVEASSSSAAAEGNHSDEEGANVRLKGKARKVKGTTKTEKHIVSAHEMHYMRNRVVKEEEKRRSYLPYKVGFFTSSTGFSRNLHPF